MERTSGVEHFNETIASKRSHQWRNYAATKGCEGRDRVRGAIRTEEGRRELPD